jgi:glycosyltransferase involved in cell wall biosynthesis
MTRSPQVIEDVSVVITAHGPSPFFYQALASALAEGPAEVIVVEDGTSGVDERRLEGARFVRLDGVGRSAARNAGVEAARSPLVAFLDDDDVTLPGRLERHRESLQGAETSPLSFGLVRVVDAAGRPMAGPNELLARRFRRLAPDASFVQILVTRCPIYTSATMVRRDAFLAVGGYDRGLDAYEDLDLYLRLSRLGPLAPCPGEPVAAHRQHGWNTPSDLLYEGALAVAAKHLPESHGRARRLLLERRVDALWGLGRLREVRREAARSVMREPLLLGHPLFAKRLLGAALPRRLAERRS